MLDETIGDRIKALRGHALTQRQLADAAEVSIDVVRKLEQGQRHTAALDTLHRLARALGTDLPGLLGRPAEVPESPAADTLDTLRNALTSVDDLLDDLDAVELPDLAEVQRSGTYVWGAFSGGRYDLVGETLPRWLSEIRAVQHAGTADERAVATDLAGQLAQIATGTLMQLGAHDLAHATAHQAIRDAQGGIDPFREVALRHSLSHVLMRQGRQDDAMRLLRQSIQSVRSGGRTDAGEAVAGALMLRAAGAAARNKDHAGAADLIGEAGDVAARFNGHPIPHQSSYAMNFSAGQVAVIRTDIRVVARDFDEALQAARTMPRDNGLPLMSRLRHLADLAHSHAQLGQDDRATDVLLALEAMAPHLAPYQSLARAVTRELLNRRPRKRLHELAKRWEASPR